jgi:hypothetical protein
MDMAEINRLQARVAELIALNENNVALKEWWQRRATQHAENASFWRERALAAEQKAAAGRV